MVEPRTLWISFKGVQNLIISRRIIVFGIHSHVIKALCRDILNEMSLSRSVTWWVLGHQRLLLVQNMVRGLSSVMVLARLPSILFAWCAVHEERIESKPFMFVQNFSVCEWKFQLSNTVHGVTLSSCWNVPWSRYWDTHLKWFSLAKPKKLQTASYEWERCWVLKFVFAVGKCNRIFLFLSLKW